MRALQESELALISGGGVADAHGRWPTITTPEVPEVPETTESKPLITLKWRWKFDKTLKLTFF